MRHILPYQTLMEDRSDTSEEKGSHPKDSASFLSKLFFWTELRKVVKDWKQETDNDNQVPLQKHHSKELGDKLEAAWLGEENFRKKPSLIRALINVFGLEFTLYGIFYFPIHVGITILQPYFLRKLLDYYKPKQTTTSMQQAYMYASLLTLLSFLEMLSFNTFNFGLLTLGMKIRIACTSLIYRRSLQLKKNSFRKVKVGQMINLLSNDVKRFDTAFSVLHFLWIGPCELVIAAYYLGTTLGLPALAGIAILGFSLLLQMFLSKVIAERRMSVAEQTDYRICLMSDIITNIKIIKMNIWEQPSSNLIKAARNLEIKKIKRANYLRLANGTYKLFLTEMCSYFCVLAAVARGIPLSSEYVFVLRNIYDTIKTPVVTNLPEGVTQFAEVKISIQRLQKFLISDSEAALLNDNCVLKSLILNNEARGISAHNISVRWEDSNDNVFSKVSLKVLPGELIGITGTTGTGKSTLLQAILQEVALTEGTLNVGGVISYASQEPWIFPSSIKQNILFGQELDATKYKKILQVCALGRVLSLLPHGDDTLVGERGTMLSAGQQARIHLARAVYREADIYLLDDPLSAIESSIAKRIFHDCILNYLKEKCVLVVAHHVSYLRHAKKIFRLKKGKLIPVKSENMNEYRQGINLQVLPDFARKFSIIPRQMQEPRVEDGTSESMKRYCSFGGTNLTICRFLFMFLMVQFLVSITDSFITFWVDLEEQPMKFGLQISHLFTTARCLSIYSILLALLITTISLFVWIFLQFSTNASRKLHDIMFAKVLFGTMTFFNSNPCGRILNRFSKDLGAIDEMIPINLKNGIEMLLSILATGVIISVLNYWMIVPTLLLFIIFLFYNNLFDNKTLTHIEGISQSQVYTHLDATIQGMSTIRASQVQKILQQEFDNHQDLHTYAFYMSMSISSAFNFWSELTRVVYTGLVIFSFFLTKSFVGNVGLAITQSLQSTIIQEAVKSWNDLGTNSTFVERAVEYTKLPSEPDGTMSYLKVWPNCGNIQFRGVSIKYNPEGPYVLKEASFVIHAGEKIGIVGNNGSGKSSLISVLFRLFHFEGTLLIDDVDVKLVPLRLLRARISVISHKSVFLQGTLRQNLDPFEKFTDPQLWYALEEVNLKQFVSELPFGLDTKVSEDLPFSVKNKRLLCLARTLLKDSKIIILDKGSLHVDSKTDKVIHSVIKKKFKECSVLIIALSLKTVIDSDKVLILNDGCVVRFCSPFELYQNPCTCR